MAINFPTGPAQGDVYNEAGQSWQYDGVKWNNVTAASNPYWSRTDTTLTTTQAGDDVTTTGDVSAATFVATGDIQSTSQNGGQLAGFRNQLINGNFLIWQRGGNFPSSPGAKYTADHWRVGANRTVSRIPFYNQYGLEVSTDTTGNGPVTGQPIELPIAGRPGPFVEGQQYTFSCVVKNSTSANISLEINHRINPDNSTGAQTVVPTTVIGSNVTATTTLSFTFEYTTAMRPTSDKTCTYVEIKSSGGTMTITNCQLEEGPAATPFEIRPIGTELALCQRYYYQVNTVPGGKSGKPTIPGIAVVTRNTTNYLTMPSLDQMRTSGMRTLATVGFHGPLVNASKGAYVTNDDEWTSWYAGQGSGFKQSTSKWILGKDDSAIYGISVGQATDVTSLQVGITVGQKVISLDAEL